MSATLFNFRITDRTCLMMAKPWKGDYVELGRLRSTTRINRSMNSSRRHCTSCMLETAVTGACTSSELHVSSGIDVIKIFGMEEGVTRTMTNNMMNGMLLGDIDPATAKVAISILGPILSAFSFLFIIRIVMSWYPKLPVDKLPYVVAYAPTEPILVVTRKVIPPLGGVDVTPVVWFGLLSFANEILVGPQGLLVLLSQQV